MPEPRRIRLDYVSQWDRPRRRSRLPRLRWILLGFGFVTLGVVMAKSHEPVDTTGSRASPTNGSMNQVSVALPNDTGAVPAGTAPAEVADETNAPEHAWTTLTVGAGDSLGRMLANEGVDHRTIHRLVTTSEHGNRLSRLRPGEQIRLALDEDEDLVALVHELSVERSLHFERNGDGFTSRKVEQPLERRLEHASGTIRDSLVGAGRAAGLSQQVTLKLAEIFAWDIDFALDLRRGDRFHLVYESLYRDGSHVRDGNIIAAEFVNAGRVHRALRYTDPEGESNYFAPDGTSIRRAFTRAPLEYTRITSTFGPRRHPKLHTMRDHNGVDYAARPGTPIRATGDGRIIRRGWHGGYGRTVIIRHGQRYKTLYAHMSRFHPDREMGSRVRQGDVIGYVGQSGLATGPHLHYEFLIDNIHRDPQTVELPKGEPVKADYRDHFAEATAPLIAQLDTLRRTYAVIQPGR